MDQSKILRIYGDILPKKSYDNGTIVPTTEKLHVKHYSNSKINNYLYKIQKNEWFERNREEVTPKTISEVNNLFNQNNQNGDWAPTEANLHPHWGTNTDQERPSHGQDTGWNAPDDSDDSFYSSTTESPRVRVNHHKNKKRQDSSYYNTEDNGQTNKKSSDWSSQVNNFVTTPQEPRPQYSTIKYKQHKTKYENLAHEGKNNVKNIFDDWSTPRSMSAYSEWLTTPETYTTPNSKPNWVSSEPSNNWSPAHQESNWVTITTPKPAAEHLSTSGPDLDEFIARQENRYKKYNSLYSGVNSYGDLSQDILTQPRDYRQTPNRNSNYNPNILKDQFDIPPNIQSYDPYSEYQDYSSSTSFNPYSSTDNFVSSTTKRPSFKENNYNNNNNNNNNFQTIYRPQGPSLSNVNFENNNRFIRNNFNEQNKRPSDFGEPETVIENKYQTTLKKHFDNTINLYESQIKQTKYRPQQNEGHNKINFELPDSKIKFEVTATETTPRIIIENYHLTTEHSRNGFSEVYNQKVTPTSQSPKFQRDTASQFSPNDIQLPGNYDYTPKKGHDVTFTTETAPIIEIGGGYSKSPPSFYEGNHSLTPPAITYEIPHLQKTEKKKPHINWCRLKSKRYITDKRCVSFEPVVESICSDNCVMPPNTSSRKAHPPPPSKRRKSAPSSWTCVESNIQWKKIKLRCQDKSIRWYNLKVVSGCDCRKKPIKITKRITVRH
ncbi:hypothetical protein M8J77_007365 [Diaphorina citri]|nr:hypothetical protein M8J77_007365 [Diaphorina citri]